MKSYSYHSENDITCCAIRTSLFWGANNYKNKIHILSHTLLYAPTRKIYIHFAPYYSHSSFMHLYSRVVKFIGNPLLLWKYCIFEWNIEIWDGDTYIRVHITRETVYPVAAIRFKSDFGPMPLFTIWRTDLNVSCFWCSNRLALTKKIIRPI